jgi:hypothetical protein
VVDRELRTATVCPIGEDHRGGTWEVEVAAGVEHGSRRLDSIHWVGGLITVIELKRWIVIMKDR